MSAGLRARLGSGRSWLIAGAVVLAAVLVVGFATGQSEQHRLDRARRAETAQRRTLRTARAAVDRQNQALHDAYVRAARLTNELAAGNADVTTTQNELAVATSALERAQLVQTGQNTRRVTVEQCLKGVKLALDATVTRNTSAATAYLRVAAPACQAALTPPGEAAPVLAFDFADPYVFRAGNQYYAFATNAAGGSVQQARSSNLTQWDLAGNALNNIPSWGVAGSIWAPAALQLGPVTLLYYTVRESATGRQCISVALSAAPGGPFLDGSSGPLECGEHGAIDPSPFVDADGTAYLLYKTERPARIWIRRLGADGRGFVGPARQMLAPSQRWEAGNVEAPSMLRHDGAYWLFYSGNDWNGHSYAEGIARCLGPTGPCAPDPANPILASRGNVAGPGGGEVFTDATGGWWLAYHAYQEPLVRYPNSRLLYFARVGFAGNGRPILTP